MLTLAQLNATEGVYTLFVEAIQRVAMVTRIVTHLPFSTPVVRGHNSFRVLGLCDLTEQASI